MLKIVWYYWVIIMRLMLILICFIKISLFYLVVYIGCLNFKENYYSSLSLLLVLLFIGWVFLRLYLLKGDYKFCWFLF